MYKDSLRRATQPANPLGEQTLKCIRLYRSHAIQYSTKNILTQQLNYTYLPPGLISKVIKKSCPKVY